MVQFEYDLEIEGHVIKALVEAKGKVWDENYGEDADGNRGVMMTMTDDVGFNVFDSRNNDITKKLIERFPYEAERLMDLAEEKLIEAYNDDSDRYEPEYYEDF